MVSHRAQYFLGPLLFLVYINDMVSADNCKLLLYADDSALMVSHRDVKVIQECLGLVPDSGTGGCE